MEVIRHRIIVLKRTESLLMKNRLVVQIVRPRSSSRDCVICCVQLTWSFHRRLTELFVASNLGKRHTKVTPSDTYLL